MNPHFLRALPAIATAIALQLVGCAMVSQEAYDRDLAGMRQQQDWLEAQKKAQDADLQVCNGKLKTAVDGLQTCTRQKNCPPMNSPASKKPWISAPRAAAPQRAIWRRARSTKTKWMSIAAGSKPSAIIWRANSKPCKIA